MKQLFIIRHAKSSWGLNTINDFDRPLNERGIKDAPIMANRLIQKKIAINTFISSTANRAFTTACAFAKAYNVPEKSIIKLPILYHATLQTLYNVVTQIPEHNNFVAIFSHNPGITEFVNSITNVRLDNMPTCAVFAVEFNDNWSNFETTEKNFLLFDYPKNV